MNKRICSMFLFLIFGLITTYAQESSYGIRMGVNVSSINSSELPENLEDGRVGVVVGFLADFPLKGKLSFQPELQYSSQGNKDERLQLNYINMPLLLKYNITEFLNIQAGPLAGIKIWEWENNDNYKTFDFSAVGGIGVNVTENIFVDLRYIHGLSDVFDDKGGLTFEGNNQVFQIALGYRM
ncbi:porin family protein [Aquimarina hainanensis]|uniref:Porin family protein n=1 Tax=Aquimarina hainanensis TaxID=1578017 RepID=A0ABW5NBQ3_9FLAO|nr:porin family protein [Aquimarina sp. TRL1]QKX06535.1 PorT family protein [Aquimarina sp. TRL1]